MEQLDVMVTVYLIYMLSSITLLCAMACAELAIYFIRLHWHVAYNQQEESVT